MKRIALFLLALSLFVPLRAQRVQNKPLDITLADIKSDDVIPMFGKPTQVDSNGIDGRMYIEYPHASFGYVETYDPSHPDRPPKYSWDGFDTDSPDFCFFSDCFPGGIRVGDRIERIHSLDIVHSKAGKGREGNGLKKLDWKSDDDWYGILGEEYDNFYLRVKDGVISHITWGTSIDWPWTEGGILWRIEGESLPAPSYILGVFPQAPADVCRHIDGLDKVWKSVKTVYREDPAQGPWGRTIPDNLLLPKGEEDMSASLYRKARAEGKEIHTLPALNHRQPQSERNSDALKDYIRRVYEAYLSQDMDEIGWRLARESSSLFSSPEMTFSVDAWAKVLEPAILKEPTLIIVDVSYLISWYGMSQMVGDSMYYYRYRFTPVKPMPKD